MDTDSDKISTEMSFEEAYEALTQIVQAMETDDQSLEESLRLYEHGIALADYCNALLEKAELRIEQINQGADGALHAEPFAGPLDSR